VLSEKEGFRGGWRWQLPVPEDGQQFSKVSAPELWTPSPNLDTFGADGFANPRAAMVGNGQGYPGEWVLDSEGLGCICRSCGVHFGTVAGWRAHTSRGGCTTPLDISKGG